MTQPQLPEGPAQGAAAQAPAAPEQQAQPVASVLGAPAAPRENTAARTDPATAEAPAGATVRSSAAAEGTAQARGMAAGDGKQGDSEGAARAEAAAASVEHAGNWRHRRHRRLSRLRVGWHDVTPEQLGQLQLSTAWCGFRFGRDQRGAPVVASLFAEEPVTVVVFGELVVSQLLALRALRTGARVVAFSSDIGPWRRLGTERVILPKPGADVALTASASAPVLRVHKASDGPAVSESLPAWTSRLIAVENHSPAHLAFARDADVLCLSRTSPGVAGELAGAGVLSRELAAHLPVLDEDMMIVRTAAGGAVTWLDFTESERERFAPPAMEVSR
ncbi:hypothetical protein BAY61_22495 [Prauserella marina]|uniref:Uncharacterized protein n=1 Tax=Prauserella marina TaxID=530584 RepID=A0A222VTS0_9PSEU|nr:hypothetical protein [Prauserella marina]ASR37309.1 hypothetical protein BAY61_22495 [Prauserella marina]PWV74838.1 hypothetical protein DES30_107236 [Prauserella marina]SDD39393.1 hypothetical protein SAMN05421630_10815 [Prauserella marina]